MSTRESHSGGRERPRAEPLAAHCVHQRARRHRRRPHRDEHERRAPLCRVERRLRREGLVTHEGPHRSPFLAPCRALFSLPHLSLLSLSLSRSNLDSTLFIYLYSIYPYE